MWTLASYGWPGDKEGFFKFSRNRSTFKQRLKTESPGIEIPLPPLDEQWRIAAILDLADELAAEATAGAECD